MKLSCLCFPTLREAKRFTGPKDAKSPSFSEGAYGHPLFISTKRSYFPWDHINCIKVDLSNDSKDFIIPWDLLKPVPLIIIIKLIIIIIIIIIITCLNRMTISVMKTAISMGPL